MTTGEAWVTSEVLHDATKKRLAVYLASFVEISQAIHKEFRAEMEAATSTVQGGSEVTTDAAEQAVYKHLVATFGDPPCCLVLAQIIVRGAFVY